MPQKILVIDDEHPTLTMFTLTLTARGFEVYTALNGEQGLALLEKHTMPIVLTDLKMPGMDGLEVLKQIKAQTPVTEVIIITGQGDMDLALKALSLNATDFINKPIQQDKLDSALKRAHERIQQNRTLNDDYNIRKYNGTGVIEIMGPINSGSANKLRNAFDAVCAERKKLVLSFSPDTSINSAGIALLTQLLLDCRRNQIRVALTGLSDNFRQIVDMVGMNKLAGICDCEKDAFKAI